MDIDISCNEMHISSRIFRLQFYTKIHRQCSRLYEWYTSYIGLIFFYLGTCIRCIEHVHTRQASPLKIKFPVVCIYKMIELFKYLNILSQRPIIVVYCNMHLCVNVVMLNVSNLPIYIDNFHAKILYTYFSDIY